MKKIFNAYYDEKPELYRWDGQERYMITVSGACESPEDAADTVTGETGGNCFGPADAPEWVQEFLTDNFGRMQAMEKEEEDDRIEHLSEEWGLTVEDLEYLR